MKKILFALILLVSVTLIFSSCNSNDNSSDEKNNTNEIYMNEKGSWSNGVEFEILDHRITSEINSSYITYTTQNKFVVLKLQVYNGSSNAFSADATDVWLSVNGAKIYQQNFVERDVNGFSNINQSPTTTKYYYLIFEVGNDISMDDLKLVVHNGSIMKSESIVINLKNSPKDCTVVLNYAYERENDTYNFYSGTTVYPSNFPTPEREGYEFLGWYFNADYNGECLENKTLTQNQSLTLYAKWKKIIHINYHYQYENKTESVLLEEKTNYSLVVPFRLGYTFGGWFSNSAYIGNKITELTNPQDDVNVFAKWTGNSVNIIFNGNGATSGAMENQAAVVGESQKLSENKYSKEGYIFLGWVLNLDDVSVYDDASDFTMIPTDKESITLYAKWRPRNDIPYKVHHYLQNANDEKYTLKQSVANIGVADSVIFPTVNQYDGFTSPNVKTVTVSANGSLIVDYYYTRNSYTVSFVTNGGSSSIDTLTQKYDTTFDLPTIERTGYTFGGWFIDPELTTPLNIFSVPSKNISIYAWWQEENKPNDFTYLGTDSIEIKAYIGENTMVHIPSYIGGVCVREISSYAFYNKNLITKVVIPNSVNSIGSGAFNGCSSIEEMVLPFIGATLNTENIYPLGYIFGTNSYVGSLKISQNYFKSPNGRGYYDYQIPSGLRKIILTNQTEILPYSFMNCSMLEEIILPDNITVIGEQAFAMCSNITKIDIGDSVLSIGEGAFAKCTKLSMLNSTTEGVFKLPSKLRVLEPLIFSECSKAQTILTGNIIKIGYHAFANCSNIVQYNSSIEGELVIPNTVESIDYSAFCNLSLITKVVIPNSVNSIGSGAFNDCSSIEEMVLPFIGATLNTENIYPLGYIFGTNSYVGSLKISQNYFKSPNGRGYYDYQIPSGLRKIILTNQTEILPYSFMNCSMLEEIILPDNITVIGEQAFAMCSNITKIDIGDSVLSIGEGAFAKCTKLKEIYIPMSVTNLCQFAFNGCTSLTIKCEFESIPSTWESNWNYSNCTVVMGENKK